MNEKIPRLHVVDALRGFAIVSIMLLHNIEHFDFYYLPTNLPEWMIVLDKWIWDGLFFLFGRDALTGTVLTLQHLLEFNGTMSELKNSLPKYFIAKKKIESGNLKPDKVLKTLVKKYQKENINLEDGLRIDFNDHWVHFRKSNTEPIIRCIIESYNKKNAVVLAEKYYNEVLRMK